MKTLIMGLGNTILTDDGVGIYVSRRLQKLLNNRTTNNEQRTTIQEASIGGFNFIDALTGFDKAVIIDAIHTKKGRPGEFYELDPDCLKPSARLSSLHGIDFATACDMAKRMEIDFPTETKIYVMEVEDEFTFGERCTSKVEASIPKMAEAIYKQLMDERWV